MCSIMGYCSRSADFDAFKKGFDRTVSRGPDDTRIVDTGNGLLGFHRLAIMGLTPSGMQPFQLGNSYATCNGEIYGFEKLKEQLSSGYTFQSDSDCEFPGSKSSVWRSGLCNVRNVGKSRIKAKYVWKRKVFAAPCI